MGTARFHRLNQLEKMGQRARQAVDPDHDQRVSALDLAYQPRKDGTRT